MTDLIDAVNALTKPSRTKVVRDDDGTTTVVRHDALLVQLEQAVTSAIGSGGGGGSATGAVLNDEALYRATVIRTQIGDWCRLVKVRVTRNSVDDLRRWLVAFTGRDQEAAFYTRTLEQWAADIANLLDPPKTVPLKGACPVCKAASWSGVDGSYRASPVAALYDHANPIRSARAVCRVVACGTEWVGADAVEELIADMSEREEVIEGG